MMRFWKNHLLASGLLLLGLVFAVEIRIIFAGHRRAALARARLELKLRELKRIEAVKPAPTEENAVAIERDLDTARQVLDVMQSQPDIHDGAVAQWRNIPVPPGRLDAYFDLTTFIEQTRERAARLGVGLKPDEYFGFSAYAAEGPDTGLIPVVFRQRLMVQYFIDALLDAHPQRIISIQRETPSAPVERASSTQGKLQPPPVGPLAPDLFVMDSRLSLRVPGATGAMAFRLVFIGSTVTLRAFLNRLAGLELPVVVRCVEAEPAEGPGLVQVEPVASDPKSIVLAAESAGGVTDSAVPVVMPVLSRFTVTVQFIDLARGGIPPPSGNGAGPAA
jgi:hypothetical protein